MAVYNHKAQDRRLLAAKKRRPAGVGGGVAHELLQQISRAETEDDERSETDEIKILYRRVVELIRGEFSEQDWQAFVRVVMESQRAGDVANDLGITRNQVYLAKSRILHRVRREFAAE